MAVTTIKNFKFPARPERDAWTLTDKQKIFLDISLFNAVEPWVIFKSIVLGDSATAFQAKKLCGEFLESLDAMEYVAIRMAELDKALFNKGAAGMLSGKKGGTPVDEGEFELPSNFMDIVKSEAWKRLVDSGFSSSEEWKIFLTMAMKQVQTDTDVEQPRRYLAETCSGCRYKAFCENPDNVKDLCLLCSYREKALESGMEEITYKEQFIKKQKNEIQGKSN